jgi:hypothetical protein
MNTLIIDCFLRFTTENRNITIVLCFTFPNSRGQAGRNIGVSSLPWACVFTLLFLLLLNTRIEHFRIVVGITLLIEVFDSSEIKVH